MGISLGWSLSSEMKSHVESKSFLFGLGAQKAGTTWLFNYLSGHPQAAMNDWKEYGFWDTLLLGDQTRQLAYQERLVKLGPSANLPNSPLGSSSQAVAERARRQWNGLSVSLNLMENPSTYMDHFEDIAAQQAGTRLVGDITPSYARLREGHLTEVKDRVETAGFCIKPVFLVREPLCRLKSAYSMYLRRKLGTKPIISFEEFAISKPNVIRTRYEETVAALDSAFGPENVYFAAYESFFNADQLHALCAFLNIDLVPANFEKKVNPAKHAVEVDPEVAQAVYNAYEPTRQFLYKRFPSWDLESLWKYSD